MRRILTSVAQRSLIPIELGVGSPIPFDEFFDNVVLLLDWAGNDGDTSTTDLSNSGHSSTFGDDAQVDTAIQSPEGTNSLLLDGNDGVTIPDSVDWDFGTADFTVECSVRFASVAGVNTLFGHTGGAPDAGMTLSLVDADDIQWRIGTTVIALRTLSPELDTYYHIAVSRTGTDLRIFFDGVQSGATITDSTAIGPTARDLDLGSLLNALQFITGLMGAVRITKGVGRYTSNFTPPSEFYPTSGPGSPAV